MERIDKLLAHEGIGTRKDIKRILRTCEVLVNGIRVTDAGFLIDEKNAVISIDGEEINLQGEVYLMMNKITDTVSSNKDGDHQTVFDLLSEDFKTPYLQEKLHLIGRLDMDTEGLLLFTTDGNLTHRLISPKSHISKTYFVSLEHTETEEHKKEITDAFKKGIHIEREANEEACDCLPAEIIWCSSEQIEAACKNSSQNPEKVKEAALLTIYEGKYHQVKRMFQAAGNTVVYLKRLSMGKLQLDKTLSPGSYRQLSESELDKLN